MEFSGRDSIFLLQVAQEMEIPQAGAGVEDLRPIRQSPVQPVDREGSKDLKGLTQPSKKTMDFMKLDKDRTTAKSNRTNRTHYLTVHRLLNKNPNM